MYVILFLIFIFLCVKASACLKEVVEAGRQGERDAGKQGGKVTGRQGGREAGRQGGREAGRGRRS